MIVPFARQLVEHRKRRGLTRKALGDLVNVTPDALANYETGRREPSFETLIKIARALGVTPNELLGIREAVPAEYCKHLLRVAGFEVRDINSYFVEVITPAEVFLPPTMHSSMQTRRLISFENSALPTFVELALKVNADHFDNLIKHIANALGCCGSADAPVDDRAAADDRAADDSVDRDPRGADE